MSRKCRAFSKSKLGIEPADNRKAFYAGWEAALAEPEPVLGVVVREELPTLLRERDIKPTDTRLYTSSPQRKPLTDEEIADEWEHVTGHNISHGDRQQGRAMYISPDEVTEFARAVIAKVTGRKE